jgi:hypothetical protein
MFGTDEHSQALLGQWRRSKQLRDPAAVKAMAEKKGLQMHKAHTLDAEMYLISRAGTPLTRGNLETVAKFVDEYSIVSAL